MIACPKCGWELQPGARACRRCGAEVPGAGAPSVTGAERPIESQADDPVRAQLQRFVASLYAVEQSLGRGPATAVYKGSEINPPRPVALKVLPPGLGTGPAATRFKDEARKAMALNHPNVVPIYRVGLKGGAPYFIAMKLVEGRGLDAILESQGALPLPATVVALRLVAEALNYAHGRGSVHGHLKASNILVDRTGHVMVSDFGISRAIEGVTAGGAPEPAARAGEGPAGDQFALGLVALHMLGGLAPRDADALATLRDVAAARSTLPQPLVRVIETALSPDAARRYASTSDLLAAIKSIPVSDTDRREGAAVLGQLARGEAVPKLRMPSAPARATTTTVVRPAAHAAPTAKAPAVPAAPAAGTPTVKAPAMRPAAKEVPPAPRAEPAPPPAARPAPAPPPAMEPRPATIAGAAPLRRPVPPPPAEAPVAPLMPEIPPVTEAPRASQAPRAPQAPEVPPSRVSRTAEPNPPEPAEPPALELEPSTSWMDSTPAAPAAEPLPPPRASAGRQTPPFERAVPEAGEPEAAPAVPERPLLRRSRAAPSFHGMMEQPEPESSRSRVGLIVGAVVVVAALAGGAYFLVLGRHPSAPASAPTPVATPAAVPASPAPSVPVAAESLRPDTAHRVAAKPAAGADTAAPRETTGQLLLAVADSSAQILLDGAASGSGGFLDSDVTVGRRHLQVSAPGYTTLDTTITVRAGATIDLGQISLHREAPTGPPRGWLWLGVTPANARILVDGQLSGTGSLSQFEVTAGLRRLQITAPGYQALDTMVSVDAGANIHLPPIALKAAPGP